MKTDGIIFDIDGTLWNANEPIAKAYTAVLKEQNIDKVITADMFHSVMGLQIEDIADVFFPEYAVEERMRLIHMCCDYELVYLRQHGCSLYPDVQDTIKKLSEKYPLYIVSNCPNGYIETLLAVHDLKKYFTDYECSGNTGRPKCDNLKHIVQRNDMKYPVYIGDTMTDQISCKEAGVTFVYASYGFGEADDYAASIATFSDVKKLFLHT